MGIWSAVVGRKGPFLCHCLCRRRGGFPCKSTPSSPHSTPPRLRTGESMHLVCCWPSLTSMVRREQQLWVSGVRWWVGTVRFCVCVCRRGEFPCKMTLFSPHSTPPRLRTGEPMHLVCVWPSPTSMARREHHLWPSGVRWWVGTVRFCVCMHEG